MYVHMYINICMGVRMHKYILIYTNISHMSAILAGISLCLNIYIFNISIYSLSPFASFSKPHKSKRACEYIYTYVHKYTYVYRYVEMSINVHTNKSLISKILENVYFPEKRAIPLFRSIQVLNVWF